MFELDEDVIKRIYQYCNSTNVDQLLQYVLNPRSGITIDGLRKANYKKIDLLETKYYAQAEDAIWAQCQNDLVALNDYLSKCDQGILSGKYKQAALNLRGKMAKVFEENDWATTKNSHDITLLDSFIQKCYNGTYSKEHLGEAENLMNELLIEVLNQEWNIIKATVDLNQKRKLITDFIKKYSENVAIKDSKELLGKYLADAKELLDGLDDEEKARIDWIDAKAKNTILGYVHFLNQHPHCSYREEVEKIISEKKGALLSDMRLRPFHYNREMMYELLKTNTLTQKELVDDSYILTDRAYNHILEFPTLGSEQRQLPVSRLENPTSEPGNTDVYFFGVSGSGKTCVLAGLMSLAGQCGFKFDPKGPGGGGNYAMELQRYAKKSMLPPATDQNYIQVIDASINDEEGGVHKLSLIEMSGEKTAQFASIDNPSSLDDLGPGAAGLLSNDNRKLIFFVVDPTNDKEIQLGENRDIWVQQSNVLDCVSSLLAKNPSLLKKIVSIHVILTKSDSLGEHLDKEKIDKLFMEQGYSVVLDNLKQICKDAHINVHKDYEVKLTPFCLGKFRPGDVYTFDDTDSMKILRVIQRNTESVAPNDNDSWWKKLENWFNS